jgi:hypothetical protein
MTTTSGLAITYPTEFENPFTTTFAIGIEEVDLWLRCALEDALTMLVGGGNMALVTNTFSWDAALYLIAGRSGQVVTIPAGSITLADGYVAWLTGLTRPLVSATLSSISTGAAGPGWDKTKWPLFYRIGTNVYLFCNVIGLERVTV